MNAHTSHQIIEHDGKPMFVVVPYDEYVKLAQVADDNIMVPIEVAEIATLGNKSMIRAWREYLGFTQEQAAEKIGITRPAYAQMEATDANPRRTTLEKIAAAFGVQVEQLTE